MLFRSFFRQFAVLRHFVTLEQLAKNPAVFRDPTTGAEGINPATGNLIRGHFRPEANDPINRLAMTLAQHWTPIVPLRDPLATLVSAKSRAPEADAMHYVHCWVTLIEAIGPFIAAHYLPLDLLKTPEDRATALSEVVEAAELLSDPNAHVARTRWALEWPKDQHNSIGVTDRKIAYANGDVRWLRGRGGLAPEIDALVAQEELFRPWLEKVGYRKLAWWT